MKYSALIACAILCGAVLFHLAPPHRQVMGAALQWWTEWAQQAHTNILPDNRGLNVAVLNSGGQLLTSRAFDTYFNPDSGFDRFVAGLPPDTWVLVAVQDEATQSLSEADLAALISLGGTDGLRGKTYWAYILIGRPGLAPGSGLEQLDPVVRELRVAKGTTIAGAAFPIGVQIRSEGFYGGGNAWARLNFLLDPLWHWIKAALGRA